MEVSMFNGFTDMGMMNDLSFYHHQLQVNSFDEIFGAPILPTYVNNFDQPTTNQALSCKRSAQSDLHTLMEKPIKQHKTNNNNNNIWNSYQINNVLNSQQDESNNSTMLSFSNNSSNCSNQTNNSGLSSGLITPKEEVAVSNVTYPSHYDMIASQGSPFDKQSCILEAASPRVAKKDNNFASMAQQSKDHIIAERKRREKLSQKFIALSAIIPGLKKMDKASVLGDAIKYVKQLQERVTKLEEEAKKKTVESAVYVKRSYVSAEEEDDQLSAKTTFSGVASDTPFPEIEVRFSDKDVLFKIHCENKKGLLEKIISKIEELHLVVISNSSLTFGGSALAVTIIAQMDAEFSMTAKDLVKHIHATLKCHL